MTKKEKIINAILFVCKVSNVSDDKNIPLDNVFMNLIGKSESELISVATELNINNKDYE